MGDEKTRARFGSILVERRRIGPGEGALQHLDDGRALCCIVRLGEVEIASGRQRLALRADSAAFVTRGSSLLHAPALECETLCIGFDATLLPEVHGPVSDAARILVAPENPLLVRPAGSFLSRLTSEPVPSPVASFERHRIAQLVERMLRELMSGIPVAAAERDLPSAARRLRGPRARTAAHG